MQELVPVRNGAGTCWGSQLRSGTGLAAVRDGEQLWDQDRFGARNGTGMGLGVGLDSGFGRVMPKDQVGLVALLLRFLPLNHAPAFKQ